MMPPHSQDGRGSKTPLGDYVQTHLDREEMSSRELVRRSRDPEGPGKLQPQWMNDMIRGDVPPPALWRLRALAAGMSTNENGVRDAAGYARQLKEIKRLAAIQWYELEEVVEIEIEGGAWVTVSVPPDLSEEDRLKVVKWAETMARDLAPE